MTHLVTRRAIDDGPAAILRWEPLPPTQTGKRMNGWLSRVVKDLRERPGRWALCAITTKGRANGRAASGRAAAKRHGWSVECASRKTSDGRYGVYARWIEEGP